MQPVRVDGISDAVSIAAASTHVCAALRGGAVHCWGQGGSGQLGTRIQRSITPVVHPSITNAVRVFAGGQTSCAILADRTARCWGSFNPDRFLDSMSDIVDLTVSERHLCVVLASGSARCLGDPLLLGNETATAGQIGFVEVTGLTGVVRVVSGGSTTCAALRDQTVWCWGADVNGSLGLGDCNRGRTIRRPEQVMGLREINELSAYGNSFCALQSNGVVHCWGTGATLALGVGSVPWLSTVPIAVPGVYIAASIGAPNLAVSRAGSVVRWSDSDANRAPVIVPFP
jgi:alpha-tubulin suppressor-like RCC1 family protein